MPSPRVVPLAAATWLSAAAAIAQPCTETWFPQFVNADLDNQVYSMLEHNEAGESVLYLGGAFGVAGGVPAGLVRWDGTGYSALGSPPLLGVYTLTRFDDDGPGPNPERLYAGGSMSGLINHVARLVGDTWEEVGAPPILQLVRCLAVCDHGGGPVLYAGGDLNGIVRLNGTSWQPVGTGMTGESYAMRAFDEDGPGPGAPALYVAGFRWIINATEVLGIARWNGAEWTEVGGSVDATGYIWAMEVHDEDGPGPAPAALYVGGRFTGIAGVPCENIARWDGLEWTALGSGLLNTQATTPVLDLRSIDDDGAGPTPPGLYVGGHFSAAGGQPAQNVAVWRAGAWAGFASSPDHFVRAIEATTTPGQPPQIFAGGSFQYPAAYAAKLVDNTWAPLSQAVVGTITRLGTAPLNGQPHLLVGGQFTAVGGGAIAAPHVAAWDGEQWSPMGQGVNGDVMSFTLHDQGSGPELYAGGQFSLGNGIAANRVASLQGAGWSAFGSGADGPVRTGIAFDDDGAGPNSTSLFIGGTFGTITGTPAVGAAKWDGTSWSSLGVNFSGGFSQPGVNAFETFGAGGPPSLYIGGAFTILPTGAPAIRGMARWDGAQVHPVGGGFSQQSAGEVHDLRVFDPGSGAALFAAGRFDNIGGIATSNMARWDGASWATLGTGVGAAGQDYVFALEAFTDGLGPALYAGGTFTTAGGAPAAHVARWRSGVWSSLGAGLTGSSAEVRALKVFDDGTGPALYAAGTFDDSGGLFVRNIARWNGTAWTALTANGLNNSAMALDVYNDGTGAALYIGGYFQSFTGFTSPGLVRWRGGAFTPSGGVGGATAAVFGLHAYDLGGGPALLVGGPFTMAGIQSVNNIARWTGSVWAGLGSGPNGAVRAMTTFDSDGGGPQTPELFAAGFFSQAGGVPASSIARWDGATWAALGSGVTGGVRDLQVFDDGSGSALYAAGSFTQAGGLSTLGIARWKPAGWSVVGGLGLSGNQAYALEVFDDGTGPKLYMGGEFTGVLNVFQPFPTKNIAKWNGSQWSGVGGDMSGAVLDLAVLDTGTGAQLYAAGGFTMANQTPASRIARWNGQVWEALGAGLNSGASTLASFEDALGPAVYAAGPFTRSGDVSAKNLARWGCGPDLIPCYPDCNGDDRLTVADFGCFQTLFVAGDPYTDCTGDTILNVSDFGCFQTQFVVGCP